MKKNGKCSKGSSSSVQLSRRGFLGFGVIGLVVPSLVWPSTAGAVYVKEEALQGNIFLKERNEKANLLKASLRQQRRALESMEFYVSEYDCKAVCGALRAPPFSTIRKDSAALLPLLGEGDRARARAAYEGFLAALEKFDRLSAAGINNTRGSAAARAELYAGYFASLAALKGYVASLPEEIARE
uniref:Uncharacterized protein n=1 Tax=Heterosigma akashiwo TaxID=2829 RepID=A0A7S3XU02_HETAK